MDPRIGSLDIETYGIASLDWDGMPSPDQTVYHPRRSLHTDKVPYSHQIYTCSLTIPKVDPRPVGGDWNGDLLASLVPGDTMVFRMWVPDDVKRLVRWLCHLDTLIFKDGLFDICYLRRHPSIANVLNGVRHLLIDASIINFLHYELQPEKSLKDLGPLYGIFSYEEGKTMREGHVFPSATSAEMHSYNAQDTHNTMLLVADAARRIMHDFNVSPPSGWISPLGIESNSSDHKLTPYSLQYFSDRMWTCIRMKEAGIPMSRYALADLEELHQSNADDAALAAKEIGLILSGPGSDKSKREWLQRAFEQIDLLTDEDGTLTIHRILGAEYPTVLSHPLVEYTKTGKLAIKDINIQMARLLLPADHPHRTVFDHWTASVRAMKVISSYTYPLLRHRKSKTSKGSPQASVLLPTTGDIGIAYPSIYIVPSSVKDAASTEGGQRQARPSFKDPSAQTFPPDVKKCISSRFGDAGTVLSFDLSQIELRAAALLSGDTSLIMEYSKAKPDLHTQRAIDVYGPDIVNHPYFKCGDMTLDPRQWAKRFNFADLYLAGAAKMQATLLAESGVLFPIEFFLNVVAQRPFIRPGLTEWQQRLLKEAEFRNHLIFPFIGMSRTFIRGGELNKPNEIVNFPVQLFGAATLGRIQHHVSRQMPSLNDRSPWGYMFLDVYDATYFDVRHSHIDQLKGIIADAVTIVATQDIWSHIEDLYGRHVPLTYDVTVQKAPLHKEGRRTDEGTRIPVAAGSPCSGGMQTLWDL